MPRRAGPGCKPPLFFRLPSLGQPSPEDEGPAPRAAPAPPRGRGARAPPPSASPTATRQRSRHPPAGHSQGQQLRWLHPNTAGNSRGELSLLAPPCCSWLGNAPRSAQLHNAIAAPVLDNHPHHEPVKPATASKRLNPSRQLAPRPATWASDQLPKKVLFPPTGWHPPTRRPPTHPPARPPARPPACPPTHPPARPSAYPPTFSVMRWPSKVSGAM